jgi:hypothetical protein
LRVTLLQSECDVDENLDFVWEERNFGNALGGPGWYSETENFSQVCVEKGVLCHVQGREGKNKTFAEESTTSRMSATAMVFWSSRTPWLTSKAAGRPVGRIKSWLIQSVVATEMSFGILSSLSLRRGMAEHNNAEAKVQHKGEGMLRFEDRDCKHSVVALESHKQLKILTGGGPWVWSRGALAASTSI